MAMDEITVRIDATEAIRQVKEAKAEHDAAIAAAEQRGYERGRAEIMRECELGRQRRDILDETRGNCADIIGCVHDRVAMSRSGSISTMSLISHAIRAKVGGDVYQEWKSIDEVDLHDDNLASEAFSAVVYKDLARRIAKTRAGKPITVTIGDVFANPPRREAIRGIERTPGPLDYPVAIEGCERRLEIDKPRETDPHGERLSPDEHRRQLREKLAASRAIHGPAVYCQSEED